MEISNIDTYPAPASNELNILFNGDGNDYYTEIYNNSGKLVLENDYHSVIGQNILKLDTRRFPNGLYFLKIGNKRARKIIKFFIKH